MKQIWIPRTGPPSVLEVREAPDPVPGPGQVRVRVGAAGVNFADLSAREGLYYDAPPLPAVIGYEAAGRVDAVGDGVDPALVGVDVAAFTRFGGYSDTLVLPAEQVFPCPPGMSAADAASLPVAYATVWMALMEVGRIRPGDRVLVHSAGGGVGLAALDLLKWKECTAVGTASSSKHAFLRDRGYDELVDYTKVDFEQALSNGPKFDLILDPIGGSNWARNLRLLRKGGRLVCFGLSENSGSRSLLVGLAKMAIRIPWSLVNPLALMRDNRGISGINMASLGEESARMGGWMGEVMRLWSEGHVRPFVHARVPFSRAAEAHQMLHDRKNLGKVVLVPDALYTEG